MARIIINVPTNEGDAQEIVNMIEGWIEPYLEHDLGWGEEQTLEIKVEADLPDTCNCDDPCERECPCNNIPCEDDEGICEHPRGCLHGECECECEF